MKINYQQYWKNLFEALSNDFDINEKEKLLNKLDVKFIDLTSSYPYEEYEKLKLINK